MIDENKNQRISKLEDQERLHHAAAEGRIEEVKTLLAAGADPNKRNRSGQPPLHLASNVAVAETLVQAGADVNLRNTVGRTPLHRAAMDLGYRRNPEWSGAKKAEFLLKHGADPDLPDVREKNTSLMMALARDNTDVAWILIVHGADINLCSEGQRTMLHLCGDADLMENLISLGLDVKAVDEGGNTPLHLCENAKCAQVLVSHGALVDATNEEGRTPLHTCDNIEVLKYLVSQGADIHAQNQNGDQPIHLARTMEKINFLLERGATLDDRNNFGLTPLHLCWDAKIALTLIGKGADINAMSPDQVRPVHFMAYYAMGEMVELLFAHGAKAEIADSNALHQIVEAIARYDSFENMLRQLSPASYLHCNRGEMQPDQPENAIQAHHLIKLMSKGRWFKYGDWCDG